jgi:HD-GYP domain-containing protein (c-di-GMP phosphodiesterase class II)
MNDYFIDNKDIEKLKSLTIDFLSIINTINDPFHKLLTTIKTDYSDGSHSTNVAFYAMVLAQREGYKQEQLIEIGIAGLLHDIGKGAIDESIINKKGRLNEEEFEAVKQHPTHSRDKAQSFGINNLAILSAIVSHHENYDGTGYPNKTRGRAIPKMGQILAICDAFDTLTTDRVYRTRYTVFDVLLLIRDERNEHFMPSLINNFFNIFHAQ